MYLIVLQWRNGFCQQYLQGEMVDSDEGLTVWIWYIDLKVFNIEYKLHPST